MLLQQKSDSSKAAAQESEQPFTLQAPGHAAMALPTALGWADLLQLLNLVLQLRPQHQGHFPELRHLLWLQPQSGEEAVTV